MALHGHTPSQRKEILKPSTAKGQAIVSGLKKIHVERKKAKG